MLNASVGPSTSRQCPSDATPGYPSCSHRNLSAGLHRHLWQSNRQLYRQEDARKSLLVAKAKRRDPIIAPYIPLGEHPEDGTDMYGYLLRNRVIFIGSRINDELATQIVASLLALETLNDSDDIKFYINSPGGQAYSIISILDTLGAIKPDVVTIALGQCASTATLLLAAGTKGKRFSMPNARIMMHQPSGGAMGSADEVNIQASELNRTMKVVHKFYERFTGLPLDRIEEETDRDNFMNPKQAKELGLIDDIILSADLPALAAAVA